MPMIPEAYYAAHACSRIGAIHSIVFGGFAPEELASRISHAEAKLIITASCGQELKKVIPYVPNVDRALQLCNRPELPRIIVQRPEILRAEVNRYYIDYVEAIEKTTIGHDVVPVESDHPLYVLYTSGTTGFPKGILRSHGESATVYKYKMNYLFNTYPKECFWSPSDIGWVVGHSFSLYATNMAGAHGVIYEGKPVGTPNAGEFWRLC